MSKIRKVMLASLTRKEGDDDFTFILSDDTVDRYGDVIEPAGWALKNFKKNPIALFNHNSDFPIGTWADVKVQGNRLVGKLKLAAKGTSDRLDELISLIEQGILRAVSVGFMPIKRLVLDGGGYQFVEQELLEASLVSVPANPSTVQLARSMGTSDDVIGMVFGVSATRNQPTTRTAVSGANSQTVKQRHKMEPVTLTKRIEDAQARLTVLRDQLTDHIATIGDEPDEAQSATTDDLNAKLAAHQRLLEQLQSAEQNLAARTVERAVESTTLPNMRPFAVPAMKLKPQDYVWRSLVVAVKAHCDRQHRPMVEILRETYGEDEKTKAVMDVVTRAATVPATTTGSGWAAELVSTSIGEFFEALMPQTVYPGLSARGGRFTFGRNGIVSLPTRASTPTIAGSFVGQGSPIPVRQGAFAAVSLTPKKMGVISTFTREIAEHSTPSIEALIRQAITEDTGTAIDSVLLDANAATSVRPAGIREGVAESTVTAGGGFAALVGDIKELLGDLITSSNGNLRNPVWIMNPVNALAAALTQNAGGNFPFKQEIAAGTFQGYPLLTSATVPVGMMILVDAADFFSATGDQPRFDVSDQAVLHMEDTTPLAIGTVGTPNVVAAPVRSLWQTDTLAVRMLLDMNWAFRRTGVVAWLDTVTW